MVEKREILAVVPARGGSKSIPKKNIKLLGGIPLIAYSIAAGLHSKLVTRVIVSTDSEEIAQIAKEWGAEVPFLRPPELAADTSLDIELFEHALTWFEENENYVPEMIVQLRPTTPLRPPDCVDNAIQIMLQHPDADSVRGVVPSGQNPYKMWRLEQGEDRPMKPLLQNGFKEPYNMLRQQLPDTYWQTGHIDVVRRDTILKQHSMSGSCIYPLVLESRYTVDIDNLNDWDRVEWMLERLHLPIVKPLRPGKSAKDPLRDVRLLVLDFDGVMTDNRVWVSEEGIEFVAAHRGDGMGVEMVRESGVEVMVLSREMNPVVAARCRKLNIVYQHGLREKVPALEQIIQERQLSVDEVIYVGNDINDLGCMRLVGCGVAVADAHPKVLAEADIVLAKPGGFGAVRELCDRIVHSKKELMDHA